MTVHFIGAGPGAADLMTLRGARLLGACPVCLYAGSTVPAELLEHCRADARLVDTAPLDLDAIEAEYSRAFEAGEDVARLHSGDLAVFSAVAEQLRRLERRGIPYSLTPGVPAFGAAAALLQRELTVPEVSQSVVLTRVPGGRASRMPPSETLEGFARTGATLAIHLGIRRLEEVVAALTPFYGEACPAAVAARVGWPDEAVIQASLGELPQALQARPVDRTALILVGPALGERDFAESALYRKGYRRRFRPGSDPGEDAP